MTVDVGIPVCLYSSTVRDLLRMQDDEEMLRAFHSLPMEVAESLLASDMCPQNIIDTVMGMYAPPRSQTTVVNRRAFLLAAVASRTHNTDTHWEMLYRCRCEHALIALAGNENTPRNLLHKFGRYTNKKIQLSLVTNMSVEQDAVYRILQQIRYGTGNFSTYADSATVHIIYAAVTTRQQTLEERQRLLSLLYPLDGQYDWQHGYRAVTGYLLNKEQLPDVVSWIASILLRNISEEILWKTSRMKKELILRALSHPCLPVEDQYTYLEVLSPLAGRTTQAMDMLCSLLQGDGCDPSLLTIACGHPLALIRTVAAQNRNCPEEGQVVEALLREHLSP